MKTWKVIIADNHSISRIGLKVVLENTGEFTVVGEATSGQQIVSLCSALQPDLVLMDINMPNGNGVEATQIIHRKHPDILVIAVSGYRHEEMQREAMAAGAIGYISKDIDFEDMLKLIRAFIAGASAPPQTAQSAFNLTNSERKVLFLLAEGHDRQQIAEMLGISLNTVKMHLRNLYQKLNVSTSDEAIIIAIQHQLIS